MSEKVENSKLRVMSVIDEEATGMSKEDCIEFIGDLLTHVQKLKDCVDEERKAEE